MKHEIHPKNIQINNYDCIGIHEIKFALKLFDAGTNTSSDHISVSVCLPQDFGLLFEFSKVTKRIFVSIDKETDD